ncbi:MAG: MOSC domain-containing protein [Gammaproteobacteria bacterium]
MSAGELRIQSLHIHPVKSCRAIDLEVARVGPRGLEHDREWMLITAAGRFVTQRSHPILALLRATPDAQGITLSHPQAGELRIEAPLPMTTQPADWRRVTVWKREIEAIDAGENAAQFASALIGEPARIVAGGSDHFADGYPLLVGTQASLDDLNRRRPDALPMSRFSPNIVLADAEAWQEDHIRELRVGGLRLKLVKPCTRCVMTRIDQLTGKRGLDPLPVLQEFRFDENLRGVTFGQNARVESGAGSLLRVGDTIEVELRA